MGNPSVLSLEAENQGSYNRNPGLVISYPASLVSAMLHGDPGAWLTPTANRAEYDKAILSTDELNSINKYFME